MSIGAKQHRNTRARLSEAVQHAPIGTLVGWKALGDFDYGIVLGRDGGDLLCLTMYDKTLAKDAGIKRFRDEQLTNELASTLVVPGVLMDVQRVPAVQAFRKGLIRGPALKPYLAAAAQLKLEALQEQAAQTDLSAPANSDETPVEEVAIQEIASNLGFKVKELDVVDGKYTATLIGRAHTEIQVTIDTATIRWSVNRRGESVASGSSPTTDLGKVMQDLEGAVEPSTPFTDLSAPAKAEETMESTYGLAGKLAAVRSLLEDIEEAKWIQKAVKKPGRLPKVLGMTQEKYDSLSKDEKLKAIDGKLKEIEGDSGKKAKSMRGALILGKRFVQGITKENVVSEASSGSSKTLEKLPANTKIRPMTHFSSWGGELAMVDGDFTSFKDRPLPQYFDPETRTRTYHVRMAVDLDKKRIPVQERYIGQEINRDDSQSGGSQNYQFTWSMSSIGVVTPQRGTFEPHETTYRVKVPLKDLTFGEQIVVREYLRDRGFVDISQRRGSALTPKDWQKAFTMDWPDMQGKWDVDKVDEIDQFLEQTLQVRSDTAAATAAWKAVKGVYAFTKNGEAFKYIVPRSGKKFESREKIEASDPRNLADTLANELITGSENIVSMVDYKRFMPELVELIMRHLKKK